MTRDELAERFMDLKAKLCLRASGTIGSDINYDDLDTLFVDLWPTLCHCAPKIKELEAWLWICYRHKIANFRKSLEQRRWLEDDSLTTLPPHKADFPDTREREAYYAERQDALVHLVLEQIYSPTREVGWYILAEGHTQKEACAHFGLPRWAIRGYLKTFKFFFKEYYKKERDATLPNLPEPRW